MEKAGEERGNNSENDKANDAEKEDNTYDG
jgi:hypothetical protein